MTTTPYTAHSVSWNLTARCNLECAHCYMSATAGADTRGELSTGECRRVVDEIAAVNPSALLILTGGEPLLRPDLWDIAGHARDRGFTTVLGTNGVLLREREAGLMRAHGVLGASISLDSTEAARHDAFRHRAGAWADAVRATRVLADAGLDFSLHMSVTDWNVGEVPAMVDLARELGARVLNFFFLVRTGRGRNLEDIDATAYERVLGWLARAQGPRGPRADGLEAGGGPPGFVRELLGLPERTSTPPPAFEDPWSTPLGRADGLLIRAKCAPHFRRILWELDPRSPLLRNYAHGSCPAGKYYCRITPLGDVTPCPYMPVSAGNLRERSFGDLWGGAPVFADLRDRALGGRCGACEFSKLCGGCRCRAYATHGDYLAEDPACGYTPGSHGGEVVELPAELTFGVPVSAELEWDEAATRRLDAIPSFARGMVARAVEAYARRSGAPRVTPELLAAVRERWGGRFRPRG